MASLNQLIAKMLNGDRLSLARLITKIEDRDRDWQPIMKQVFPLTGRAQVWGITGPPGAGKSTLVDRLAAQLRAKEKRVAICAIDPSSPFSGGAILGDRIRMQSHTADLGVFIRSIATRGKQGGISNSTQDIVRLLDAAQFDVILVETAGVGQTELDILRIAQTLIVILVPESGDSIQVMKAGIMEIADVFAVNKSDRPEADKLVRELISMVGLNDHDKNSWIVPVQKTEAINGSGVDDLLSQIEKHQTWLTQSGERQEHERQYLELEIREAIQDAARGAYDRIKKSPAAKKLMQRVYTKQISPYAAASKLFKQFG